jgi:nicotinamidase-related amidase
MTLVAGRIALIAVDLMPRTVELDLVPHLGAEDRRRPARARRVVVVARTVAPATALRKTGGTVVVVRAERPHVAQQPPGSGFVPEMAPQEGAIEVVEHTIGAVCGTGLAEPLRERGVDTVIMAGPVRPWESSRRRGRRPITGSTWCSRPTG